MKMKKLLSIVTAAAISASCFAGWTLTASAASSENEADWATITQDVPITVCSTDYVNETPNNTLTYYGADKAKYLAVKTNNKNHDGIKIKSNDVYAAIKVKGAATITATVYASDDGRTVYMASEANVTTAMKKYAEATTTKGTTAYTLTYKKATTEEQTFYFNATDDAYLQTITVTMEKATPEPTDTPTPEPTAKPADTTPEPAAQVTPISAPYEFIAQNSSLSGASEIPVGTIVDTHIQAAGENPNTVKHNKSVYVDGTLYTTAITVKGTSRVLYFKTAQASTVTVYGNSDSARCFVAGTTPGGTDVGVGTAGSGTFTFSVGANTGVYLTAYKADTVNAKEPQGGDMYVAGIKVAPIATERQTVYSVADDAEKNWTFSGPDSSIKLDKTAGTITNENTSNSGARDAVRTLDSAANQGTIKADFSIEMTTYMNNTAHSDGNVHNNFKLQSSGGADVVDICAGFVAGSSDYSVTVNGENILDLLTVTDSGNTKIVDMKVSVELDTATNKLAITVTNSADPSKTRTITKTISETNIGKIVSSLHRNGTAKNVITGLTITHDVPVTPIITVPDETVTVEVGEPAVIATIDHTRNPEITVIGSDSTNQITAEYNAMYHTVTVTSSVPNATETFTITAKIGDQTVETQEVKVTTKAAEMATLPPEDKSALTQIEEQQLVNITFDNDAGDTAYDYFDEHGTIHTEGTVDDQEYTKIDDTTNGLLRVTDKNDLTKTERLDNGGTNINGKALYSYMVPRANPANGTDDQRANGYRGSFLRLDNSAVQRTDKIKVDYDFAFYNVANTDFDGETTVGTPFSIAMTSEAEIEAGGVPYDFNENHYDEIDSDPSNINTASKHLLTLFTGRPKRNASGIHWTDMTNKLAYYEPLSDSYTDLGLTLEENVYNYFHVSAEVDFYNNLITFTVTNNKTNASKTITTTIPNNSSWNGFIMSSNKWDQTQSATDINGQDTEHYSYLDNISAVRIAEEKGHLTTTAPALKPLTSNEVDLMLTNDNSKPWVVGQAYEMTTPNNYMDVIGESNNENGQNKDFTWNIATAQGNPGEKDSGYDITLNMAPDSVNGDPAIGITIYTEFDFYLPKKGSKISATLMASGSSIGNTIYISTAGINSWSGLEDYTVVYDNPLETGKWYSMKLVYDIKDSNIQIIVSDNNGPEIANKVVYARNLEKAYYRSCIFNAPSVATTKDTENLPPKQPTFAETYIANFRVYNKATIKEYYKENTVADNAGNAKLGDEVVNSSRLGAIVCDFERDAVPGGAEYTGDKKYERALSYPVTAPKSSTGKTWEGGWELIYSNAADSTSNSDGTVTEGTGATRLKYRPVYVDLPVEEITSAVENGYYYKTFYTDLPIMTNNYKTIDWFVFNGKDNDFRMKGSFNLTPLHNMLTGEGSYRIGYVVYNIPTTETIVNAVPQAHHDPAPEIAESDLDKPGQTPPETAPTAMPIPSGAPAAPSATAKPATPTTAEPTTQID